MSKRFAFTSYLEDEWPLWKPNEMVYLVYQGERCPDTKRFHWQGYVEFKGSKRFKGVQESLGLPGAHLEKARGSGEDNRTYCTKEDSQVEGPYEYGTMGPGQGARMDLKQMCELIKSGVNDACIAQVCPSALLKFPRGVATLRAAIVTPRAWKTHVTIAWGPTGTGKSKTGHEMYPAAYWKNEGKWWDGYIGQEDVIIDDFRDDWWSLSFMLQLLDRYPLRVETKGGSVEFRARNIYISTNDDPTTWYYGNWDKVGRRVDDLIHMDKPE